MKKLKLDSIDEVPESIGVFILSSEEKSLFVKSTENLKRFIHLYTDKEHEDKNISELAQQVTSISYHEHESLIDAYIQELMYLDKNQTAFNTVIKPWFDYVYLGISFDERPYFKVCGDTLEDRYYIGPFRNSFSLNDILDMFAMLFRLPRCEEGQSVCERLTTEQCLGFCQNKLSEALPEMINRLMMVPNHEVIQKLNQKQDVHLNELEFNLAEEVSEQKYLLKKYYKNLLFSYTSQLIEGEYKVDGRSLFIKSGMIDEIISSDDYVKLYQSKMSYRKSNELLAYDKAEYDHRWIVFSFLYQTVPEMLEALFLENVVDLQKRIFAKNEE